MKTERKNKLIVTAALAAILGGCSGAGESLAPPDLTTPGCSEQCAAGQVCVAGQCVAPGPTRGCGADKFGSNLPAAKVLYVDGAAATTGDGSRAAPFLTIAEALAAVPAGDDGYTVAIADGKYAEAVQIDRSLKLVCRCPEKVALTGGLELSEGSANVAVTIDGCRIAPAGWGEQLPDGWGSCSAPVTAGIKAAGGLQRAINLVLRESEVAGWCVGVHFNAETQSSSSLCVSKSRITGNNKGIEVLNAPLSALTSADDCKGLEEAVAVRASTIDSNEFAGIHTREKARGLALETSLVLGTGTLETKAGKETTTQGGYGVLLGDTSSAHLLGNQIRDNLAIGLGMINDKRPLQTIFAITDNVLAGNHGAGIALQKLQADQAVTLRGNQVLSTKAGPDQSGDGIQISILDGTSYDVALENNLVLGSARNGVLLDGVAGSVTTNEVRDSGSYAVLVQRAATPVTVERNRFAGNGKGDVLRSVSAVDKVGSMPVPLP